MPIRARANSAKGALLFDAGTKILTEFNVSGAYTSNHVTTKDLNLWLRASERDCGVRWLFLGLQGCAEGDHKMKIRYAPLV